MLESLGLRAGETVQVKRTGSGAGLVAGSVAGFVELQLVVDETVAPGCARVAAAHPDTVALGPLTGELIVERV
jgi:NADH-quinone oxidoreductase subunit G